MKQTAWLWDAIRITGWSLFLPLLVFALLYGIAMTVLYGIDTRIIEPYTSIPVIVRSQIIYLIPFISLPLYYYSTRKKYFGNDLATENPVQVSLLIGVSQAILIDAVALIWADAAMVWPMVHVGQFFCVIGSSTFATTLAFFTKRGFFNSN